MLDINCVCSKLGVRSCNWSAKACIPQQKVVRGNTTGTGKKPTEVGCDDDDLLESQPRPGTVIIGQQGSRPLPINHTTKPRGHNTLSPPAETTTLNI